MPNGFIRQEGKTLTFWPEQPQLVRITDLDLIDELVAEKCNARICFHNGPDDFFHDMLIVEWKDLYTFPMHRHTKLETIQVLRGSMNLRVMTDVYSTYRLFRDDGAHIPIGAWHQTVPGSRYVVYREIKPGPFLSTDNELWTGDDPQ